MRGGRTNPNKPQEFFGDNIYPQRINYSQIQVNDVNPSNMLHYLGRYNSSYINPLLRSVNRGLPSPNSKNEFYGSTDNANPNNNYYYDEETAQNRHSNGLEQKRPADYSDYSAFESRNQPEVLEDWEEIPNQSNADDESV